MRFANLLAKFYYEPWCIRPDKHAAMGKLLQEYLQRGDVVGPTDYWGQPIVPQMEVNSGIAWIPVHGVLGKRLSMLELECGGCDYDYISQFTDRAIADPAVTSIVYDIDSPGGMVVGLQELASKIVAASAVKRTVAWTETECCSAGYWLAASCSEIYASPSSSVGCVGTYIAAVDTSREWEQNGWKLELFKSGALKAIGLDGKQWTDAEREFLQAKVDRHAALFRGAVTSGRPDIKPEAMEGQWFDGDEAVGLGLTNGVMSSLSEVLAGLLPAA